MKIGILQFDVLSV